MELGVVLILIGSLMDPANRKHIFIELLRSFGFPILSQATAYILDKNKATIKCVYSRRLFIDNIVERFQLQKKEV